MKTKIELGDKVKDTVSGFEGIAAAAHTYLNGCIRFTVQPSIKKDGSLPPNETFDAPQLIVVKAKAVKLGPQDLGGPAKYEDRGR